eukprot:452812_1
MWQTRYTKRTMKDIIPFLCPPKYQFKYYQPLLESSKIMTQYSFMLHIILQFVCGDLDFSVEFYKSVVWKEIHKVFDDNFRPLFNLNNSNNNMPSQKPKITLSSITQYNKDKLTHMIDQQNMQPNTMTENECKEIISQFSPNQQMFSYDINWNDIRLEKYNKMRKIGVELSAIVNKMKSDGVKGINFEPLNKQKEFWKDFKDNYFESIWMFVNDGTMMNGFDYGEYESYYWFCGVLNHKKFKAKQSGNKIYVKIFVSHYTDDYNKQGDWGLTFNFSDSLELFWLNALGSWQHFKPYTIRLFDPNRNKNE